MIQKIRSWFGIAPSAQAVSLIQPPPEWTEEDAQALQQFLAGEAGHKMTVLLRHTLVTASMNAINAARLEHECGSVVGMHKIVAVIDGLSRCGAPKDENL